MMILRLRQSDVIGGKDRDNYMTFFIYLLYIVTKTTFKSIPIYSNNNQHFEGRLVGI